MSIERAAQVEVHPRAVVSALQRRGLESLLADPLDVEEHGETTV